MESEIQVRKTLVLGASTKPQRYSFLAANRLKEAGHPMILIGRSEGHVAGVAISQDWPVNEPVHTVTIYLDPKNQSAYLDSILELKPERVIFNPGSENPELMEQFAEAGIEVLEACTLVMLSTSQYS